MGPAAKRPPPASGLEKQSTQSDSGLRREKDKSSKRKSNLNRSLAAEAAITQSDDSGGGGLARRRRRPLNGSTQAGTAAVQPEPPPPPSAPPDCPTSSPPQQERLNGIVTYQRIRDATSRTNSLRSAASGFVPVAASTRKLSSPCSTTKVPDTRQFSRHFETSENDITRKVEILTARAIESVARIDKVTGTLYSPRIGSEVQCSHSSASPVPINGHSENFEDVSTNKQSLSVVTAECSSPDDCTAEAEQTTEFLDRSKSPTKPATSILKKKSLEDQQVPVLPIHPAATQPVSILKRKTSQDEAGSSLTGNTTAPPVTFSPSVEEHSRNSRRQGILKKRASLDESEVLRRRSCSPDVNHSWSRDCNEFRPILKNQRRSSLEELVRRTQSPDLQPQSILKRKTSRDDDFEERSLASPEPQGILKRKSNVSSSSSSGSGSPHVSISQTVLMNVAGVSAGDFVTEVSDVVRPILKKKSSSEETTTADSSSADTPKPILKKKTSIDVDDTEDRPKKPILKMSKKSSQESGGAMSLDGTPRESPTRCLRLRSQSTAASDSTSGSDGEVVRPILKQPNSRERSSSPRPILSFCDDEDRAVGRSAASSGSDSTQPASPATENVTLRIHRVLCSPVSTDADDSSHTNKRHSWEPSCNLDDGVDVQARRLSHLDSPRGLSVAERIMNMESLLDRPERTNVSPPAGTGAVPKRLGLARSLRDKERFHTQPITLGELEASSMLASVQGLQNSLQKRPTTDAVQLITEKEACNSTDESPTTEALVQNLLHDTLACTSSPDSECKKLQQQEAATEESTVFENMEESKEDSGTGLTKSCSVSAMASLFAKKQEEASRETTRRPAGSSGVLRYRERRRERVEQARIATQPVTQEEVQEAVRLNQRHAPSSDGTITADDGNDDDPSKLSLSERIRLFNQKIKEEQVMKPTEPVTRVTVKRSARFRTQPVTPEELETAQKKISNLAASFAKPPDVETLGGLSARAAREKIYEHAAQMLSKSSSVTQIGHSLSSSRDTSPTKSQSNAAELESRPRGILKHSESLKVVSTPVEDITETDSENEVKGILKAPKTQSRSSVTPELDSFRRLRSVLKKETSGDERMHTSNEDIPTTSEQLKSILKPQSKEWVEEDSSSSSESRESVSDSDSEKPIANPPKRGIDLVTILHNVEEEARQQRQQTNKPVDEERIKNLRNLSQEKENQMFPSKNTDDNYNFSQKKQNQQALFSKISVDHCSNQKLVTSKSASGEQKKSNAMKQITVTNHRKNVKKNDLAAGKKNSRQIHSSPLDTSIMAQMSDGETSSSGGREVKRIIRNEAVARRRQVAINRQNRSGASSEPQVGLSKSRSQPCVQEAGGGLQRSSTQPMAAADLHDLTGASIAQRLAALQKSGSTEWRKRISHLNPEHDISVVTTKNQINELRRAADDGVGGGGVLAERLGQLDEAAQGWRKRVGPSDAGRFTVAGRLQHVAQLPPQLQGNSPYDKGARKMPRALRFRSRAAQIKNTSSTPTSPQKDCPSGLSFKRSLSAPGGDDENGLTSFNNNEEISGPKVVVPRADDETFSEFFRSVTSEKLQDDRLEIRDEDLDELVTSSSKLLVQKKSVKVHRRNITSRNPIKALAARTDLQEEYIEIKTGIAEKEIRRLNVEKLSKNSTLAVEALAGLASKEDFTAVALKKASGSVGSMLPYNNLMLIHVKGRRHVQTRLVEPVAASINRGDNYVLVTPSEVFNWVGLYSNVIERSRGAEIAQHVVNKKDLGYSGSGQVITISEEKTPCPHSMKKRFWQLLGMEDTETVTPTDAGHLDEDELYESCMIATNKVYELQDNELAPMDEYWGNIPCIQMLDPSKILVFDFGSEMYVWNGKNASLDDRRQAAHLARELWSEGYDYTGCDVCPLTISAALGLRHHQILTTPLSATERPSWALLAKVTQHMETILFREKFLDWPDFSRVIRSKGDNDTEKQVDASIDIKPCNVKEILVYNQSEPDLELEGLHLGRGSRYFDEELHRYYEISTLGVTMWHIQEYELTQLPEASVGQFHMGDSYVVRWQYSITITGRELNGQPSRHSVLGRDRCAYFYWQGREASLNEQGAAALLTVELDHERGPQLRVVQGYEPPAFLSLFQGFMVIHAQKRGEIDHSAGSPWRLFICRGALKQEAVLVEVTCSVRQLRNRGCFLLLNTNSGALHIWYGKNAPKHSREIIKSFAEKIKDRRPPEVGFQPSAKITIYEHEESGEKREFFQGLGGRNCQLYLSLPANHTPRLFHLSSLSGTFCAREVLCPYRSMGISVAFPFLQEDLYNASQPALFLLDGGSELWLWQGWWPDTTDDPSTQTGSGAVRWQAERRAAMHTALDYCQQAGQHGVPALLVWAGLEPLKFTNLFPVWTDRDDVAELNIGDGRKPGEVLTVEDELARLTQSTYPPALLLQRPLPDGVDPTCLEEYLDPQHFEKLLGMSKEEFSSLPLWKQTKLKKDVGLF